MDRTAAQEAFSEFLFNRSLTRRQIRFDSHTLRQGKGYQVVTRRIEARPVAAGSDRHELAAVDLFSALDVSAQDRVASLLGTLKVRIGLTMLIVARCLSIVRYTRVEWL